MLASKYLESVERAIAAVAERAPEIRKAAEMVLSAINGGKRVFVTDRHGILESELSDKPGCLALFRSLQRSTERLAEGDILILSALLPSDAQDLEIVRQTKALGGRVIAICSEGELSRNADLVVPDQGVESNAVLTAPGLEAPFAPVSGIVHVLLLNLIQADTAELMLAAGKAPTVLPGEYIADGKKKLGEAKQVFASRGY